MEQSPESLSNPDCYFNHFHKVTAYNYPPLGLMTPNEQQPV